MSFQAMKWAHEQSYPDSETKLLMLVLSNYAGHDNTCWPSIKRLASECLLSERTIQYKIRMLQEMKLLRVSIRQDEAGDQTSNIYTLFAPPGAALAPPPRTPCTTPGAGHAPKPVSTNQPFNQGATRTIMDLKDVMAAKEKMAQDIKNRYSSDVAFGIQWDDQDKKLEYLKLKREITQLNARIAGMQ